jgi:hypothetical protein
MVGLQSLDLLPPLRWPSCKGGLGLASSYKKASISLITHAHMLEIYIHDRREREKLR